MVQESTIRLMTRLANEYRAVNLSQGFTDEAPIYEMVWGAIAASLGGTEEGISKLEGVTLGDIQEFLQPSVAHGRDACRTHAPQVHRHAVRGLMVYRRHNPFSRVHSLL